MLLDLQQSLKTLSIAHLEGSTKLTQGDRKVRTFLESHQSPENLQRATEDDGQRQIDGGQRDADADADEATDARHLPTTQEGERDPFLADFIGDPRTFGPTHKGFANAAHHFRQDNDGEDSRDESYKGILLALGIIWAAEVQLSSPIV